MGKSKYGTLKSAIKNKEIEKQIESLEELLLQQTTFKDNAMKIKLLDQINAEIKRLKGGIR